MKACHTCQMRMFRNIVLSLFLTLSCMAGISHAQDIESHKAEKARLEQEIAMINRQLSANTDRQRDNTQQLQLIRRKISNRQSIVNEIEAQIKSYDRSIAETSRNIRKMEDEMDTLMVHYEHLVRVAYRNRDSRLWFAYILSGDNIVQTYRRYMYFKNLSASLDSRAEEIRNLKEELSEERMNLQRLRNESVEAKNDRMKEINSLKSEEANARKVEDRLKKDRKSFEKQLKQKNKQVAALNAEIKRLVEQAMREKQKARDAASGSAEIDYALSGEFSKNKGKIPWPTESHAVIETFGQHYHPVFKGVKMPYNYGVNIVTDPAATVRCVFDGVVKQIVVMPGYNQCVLVQHGDYFTFYCKLGSVSVKSGQAVSAGETIGTVDTINGDTVFHFQIWKGQTPQNPEHWLR